MPTTNTSFRTWTLGFSYLSSHVISPQNPAVLQSLWLLVLEGRSLRGGGAARSGSDGVDGTHPGVANPIQLLVASPHLSNVPLQ
jgi:hypothetical protein